MPTTLFIDLLRSRAQAAAAGTHLTVKGAARKASSRDAARAIETTHLTYLGAAALAAFGTLSSRARQPQTLCQRRRA
jgi:hypothetical protein